MQTPQSSQSSPNSPAPFRNIKNDSITSSPIACSKKSPGISRNRSKALNPALQSPQSLLPPTAFSLHQGGSPQCSSKSPAISHKKKQLEIYNKRKKLDEPTAPIIDSDPLFTELLSNYLLSEGIPLEVTKDPTFRELIAHFNPKCEIPTENLMMKYMEKQYSIQKPCINYPKTIGPISVTIDVFDDLDEKFLIFSIHFFEDIYERKSFVFLKKLFVNQVDANTLTIIRRAVNNYSYKDVKFHNLLYSNMKILRMIGPNEHVEQHHICFYHNMTNFVEKLLKIKMFSHGLDVLRRFVQFIRGSLNVCRNFVSHQSLRNEEFDLPSIGNDSWESTYVFLTKCLVLRESFMDFRGKHNIHINIANVDFNHLNHLQRLLQQCSEYCRSMSTSSSSISQIIPAIEGLRRLIDTEFSFQQEKIQDLLCSSFENYSRNWYKIAVLMDPLFSYTDIFPEEKWKELENLVIEKFANCNWKWTVHSGMLDATMMSSRERMTFISSELSIYRQLSMKERPQECDCPIVWWAERRSQFEFLSVIAREYFSCPAVSIDASHYFSESGKLQRLCKMYSGIQLEQSLNIAGPHQEFRGKGAFELQIEDEITVKMIEKLDALPQNSTPPIVRKVYSDNSPELQPETYEPIVQIGSAPAKRKRRRPNSAAKPKLPTYGVFYCTICGKSKKQPDDFFMFKREIERLIIVVGCFFRGWFDVRHAEDVIIDRTFHVCSSHIQETIEEIYEKLGLTNPKDLYNCAIERFQNMFETVAFLDPAISKGVFQDALFQFFVKYEHVKEAEIHKEKEQLENVLEIEEKPKETSFPDESDEEVDPMDPELLNSIPTTYDMSTPTNRRCTICKLLKGRGDIQTFRRESERLLIIIGCLAGESINIRQAERLMLKTNLYVCNSHIQEAHGKIQNKIFSVELDNDGSLEEIQNIVTTVTLLKPDMELSSLQNILSEFLMKYNYLERARLTQESDEIEEESGYPEDEYSDDSDYSPDESDASTSSAKRREDSDEDWKPRVVKKKRKITRKSSK